eukprot:365108-Chlamydomonas_euryale.AAC.2
MLAARLESPSRLSASHSVSTLVALHVQAVCTCRMRAGASGLASAGCMALYVDCSVYDTFCRRTDTPARSARRRAQLPRDHPADRAVLGVVRHQHHVQRVSARSRSGVRPTVVWEHYGCGMAPTSCSTCECPFSQRGVGTLWVWYGTNNEYIMGVTCNPSAKPAPHLDRPHAPLCPPPPSLGPSSNEHGSHFPKPYPPSSSSASIQKGRPCTKAFSKLSPPPSARFPLPLLAARFLKPTLHARSIP